MTDEPTDLTALFDTEHYAPADASTGPDDEQVTTMVGNVEPLEVEIGTAFARIYARWFKFDRLRGQWLRWTGTSWGMDKLGEAEAHMIDFATRIRERDRRRRKALGSRKVSVNALAVAAVQPEMATLGTNFDTDSDLLNTPGGVYNLRTGEPLENDPDLMLSMCTSVAPDFEMPTPNWDRVMSETYRGDDAAREFMLDYFALSMSGDISNERFTYLQGPGGTGKGTQVRTVLRILGSYGHSASETAFVMDERGTMAHPTEVAELSGKRLIVVSEVERGQYFRMRRVKDFTGNETSIRGRWMRQDFFDIKVAGKLLIVANDALKIRDANEADTSIIRRLCVVTCPNVPSTVDTRLKAKLEAEYPGILAQLITRAQRVLNEGLQVPPAVEHAARKFVKDQDSFGEFFREGMEPFPGQKLKLSEIADAFRFWSEENGAGGGRISSQSVRRELEARGVEVGLVGKNRRVVGYAIDLALQNRMLEANRRKREAEQKIAAEVADQVVKKRKG